MLEDATFVVEAIVEDPEAKAEIWSKLGEHLAADAVLATTTSVAAGQHLAQASGHPERFVGLHVFNPVPKMDLVELAFPPEATEHPRSAPARCARRSARPRSRSRTRRASSSTACCSRTCSTPCG